MIQAKTCRRNLNITHIFFLICSIWFKAFVHLFMAIILIFRLCASILSIASFYIHTISSRQTIRHTTVGRLGRAVRKKLKQLLKAQHPIWFTDNQQCQHQQTSGLWLLYIPFLLLAIFFSLFSSLYHPKREWGTESDELLEKVPNGHHIGKLFSWDELLRSTTY